MIPLIGPFLATKFGKPIAIVGSVLLLIGLVFLLGRCSGDDNEDVEAQVEQTNRSGEAIANAAEMAIEKVGDRTATDEIVDQAVAATVKEIGHAESSDAVRNAVINGLCGQAQFSNDPACRVQQTNP